MNFQNLSKVENSDFFLDLAFSRAKKYGDDTRSRKIEGTRLDKSQKIELAKLETIADTLKERFNMIVKSFPSLDDLPEFYKELIKSMIDYGDLKKSLAAVNWASGKVSFFFSKFKRMIKDTKHLESINDYRREYYGRISSVVKQIEDSLEFLEQARVIMKDFPSIKQGLKTIAIFGFPNVGKSTLLTKLTTSKPTIAAYPFTTKTINVGYFVKDQMRVQLLDTPGTLNRFDKMNSIEKQAYLALKYCAEEIIYVFDLTEEYPLDDQIKLFEHIKTLGKPVHVYLSKTDILDKKVVEEFKKKFKILNFEELKEIIGNEQD